MWSFTNFQATDGFKPLSVRIDESDGGDWHVEEPGRQRSDVFKTGFWRRVKNPVSLQRCQTLSFDSG